MQHGTPEHQGGQRGGTQGSQRGDSRSQPVQHQTRRRGGGYGSNPSGACGPQGRRRGGRSGNRRGQRSQLLYPLADSLWEAPNWAPPPFIGKGPKGYVRSDERIREEVCDRLSEGYLDASDIEVTVHDGEVVLSGTVCDRRAKHLAVELVDGIVGVRDLENRLKVRKPESASPDPAATPDRG